MSQYTTIFGSLDTYTKGGVQVVDDDPKSYVFSNLFEVAANSAPFEKVAVAKNLEYVIEAIRIEGAGPWQATPHDESALVMDGTVTVELLAPDQPLVDANGAGAITLDNEPAGQRMGRVIASRGHMVLLPAGRAYRMTADTPAVVLLQTIEGPNTIYRWDEICQTV